MRHTLWMRRKVLVNTDPQRRCYNGCHFSSELQWTPWETLQSNMPTEKVAPALQFWRDLNDYAVKARGPEAECEFKETLQPPEEGAQPCS